MTQTVRVAGAHELLEAGTVGVPVARDDQGLLVPQGLPGDFAGVEIPSQVDTSWAARQGFDAKPGQSLAIRAPGLATLVLLGIGDAASADADVWRRLGAAAARSASRTQTLAVLVPLPSTIPTIEVAKSVTEGALLAAYRTAGSKSTPDEPGLEEVVLAPVAIDSVTDDDRATLEAGVTAATATATAVRWARDLINRPAAQLTPRRFAHEALRLLEDDPAVTIEIWREAELESGGMGGLLGVSRGSLEPPRLVVASYQPSGAEPRGHVVLVGKGITFDSGGLNLKGFEGMKTMKTDMSGAAIVLGAISVASRLGCRAKVTSIAPITENLPGHRAMKPGDVLTARNGTTIEVLNTDAEGRLVLADGLSLAAELGPDAIIDVATLTGAVAVALGRSVAAVLGTDVELVAALRDSGSRQGEPLWELPLFDGYEADLDSDVADLKNIGKPGQAGTIVAALFLRRFAAGVPWAHLDIAGTGRAESDDGYLVKGATAFSLRTLVDYLLTR